MVANENEKKLSEAKIVFKTLCSALDNRKWRYDADESNLVVRTSAVGDDLTIKLFIKVDANRSVMFLKSPLPFAVDERNKNDLILATTIANWTMLNGMFEMDLEKGYVGFKAVAPFMESLISERLCNYLVDVSCRMVDIYNDKLDDVAKGKMSVEEFAEFAKRAV